MAVDVGIDEVGYGPVLGPLVVSAVGLEGSPPPDSRALARVARDCGLEIDDSKKVFRRRSHLGRLARTASAFLDLAGGAATLGEAVARFGGGSLDRLPWYAEDVPLERPPDAAERAGRLREALGGAAVRVRIAFVDPADFNARVARTGNKALALFDAFAGVARPALGWGAGPLRIHADAQGSRRTYAHLLGLHLPAVAWRVRHEGRGSWQYAGRAEGRSVALRFDVQADARWRIVGLASIVAKYLRECAMRAFVRYWGAEAAPPTGYPNPRTREFIERVLRPRIAEGALAAADVLRQR